MDDLYKSKKLSPQAEDSLVKKLRNAFNHCSLMNKNNKDSSMEEKSDLEKFLKSESLQKTDKKENNWGQLNEKLSSALQTWEDLSASVETKLSPDEEQLQEIKKLLKDLQTRIDEFR